MIGPNQARALAVALAEDRAEHYAKRRTEHVDGVEYYFVESKGELIRRPQRVIRVNTETLTQIEYLLEKWWKRIVVTRPRIESWLLLFTILIPAHLASGLSDGLKWLSMLITLLLAFVVWYKSYQYRVQRLARKLEFRMRNLLNPYGDFPWDEVGTVNFPNRKFVVLAEDQENS